MINDKKFIYIPSFSAGSYGNSIGQNRRFRSDKPVRLYDRDMHESLRHDWFLTPAAHSLKNLKYRDKIGIPVDSGVHLLGDSGGFQIVTGALKWSDDLPERVLRWLEANSDVAINLDIPPKMNNTSQFEHCLERSVKNFKYFYENQTGKIKLLNVLHGGTEDKFKKWMDSVKGFEFDGWATGTASVSLNCFLLAIAIFLDEQVHTNPRNEYIHFLGNSRVIDFFILSQLQFSLNKIGSNIQITTDSSSPNQGSRFGTYYTHADLKSGGFKHIHVPKAKLEGNYVMRPGLKMIPKTASCDEWLYDCYEWEDINDYTWAINCIIVLHNFGVFKDTIKQINDLIYGHPYFLEQMVNKDIVTITKIIDEMVVETLNGTTAMQTYRRHKVVIDKIDHRLNVNSPSHSDNEFF